MSPQALSRELDEAYQNGDGESRQLLAEPGGYCNSPVPSLPWAMAALLTNPALVVLR